MSARPVHSRNPAAGSVAPTFVSRLPPEAHQLLHGYPAEEMQAQAIRMKPAAKVMRLCDARQATEDHRWLFRGPARDTFP